MIKNLIILFFVCYNAYLSVLLYDKNKTVDFLDYIIDKQDRLIHFQDEKIESNDEYIKVLSSNLCYSLGNL